MNTNHTPTPWYQDGFRVMLNSGSCICEINPLIYHAGIGQGEYQEANAAFIVRAVNTIEAVEADNARLLNAHDELVNAAKKAVDRITHKLSCPPRQSNFQAGQSCKCGRDEIVNNLKASIAKAEGR